MYWPCPLFENVYRPTWILYCCNNCVFFSIFRVPVLVNKEYVKNNEYSDHVRHPIGCIGNDDVTTHDLFTRCKKPVGE